MSKANAGNMAVRRIKKEIADLAKENLGSLTLVPNESNIFVWKATLPGPAGSPYEGGVFDVDIRVPEDYPFSPPKLQFMTRLYHCNVSNSGAICLDLLKNAWSPALSLYKVILSLSSLLTDPNPADPLVPHIAHEYKRDRKKHDETAREWTKLYAAPKAPLPTTTAAATKPSSSRTTSTTSVRSRAIPRAGQASSSSSQPPPQIAGTRRTHAAANGVHANGNAIDIVDSDDEQDNGNGSDVEVLGESAVNENGDGTNSNGGGTTGTQAKARAARNAKRARVAAGANGNIDGAGSTRNGGDEVIVIDE